MPYPLIGHERSFRENVFKGSKVFVQTWSSMCARVGKVKNCKVKNENRSVPNNSGRNAKLWCHHPAIDPLVTGSRRFVRTLAVEIQSGSGLDTPTVSGPSVWLVWPGQLVKRPASGRLIEAVVVVEQVDESRYRVSGVGCPTRYLIISGTILPYATVFSKLSSSAG